MPEFTLDPDSAAQETRAELDIQSHSLRSTALTGLFVLACFYSLYFAREFFLPLALALVLSFLLWPIVRALARIHVPEALGAVVVILGALAVLAFIGYEFSGPVSQWIARAPELAQRLEREVNNLKRPVQQVTKATEQVTAMADTAPASAKKPTPVVVKAPGFGEVLLSRGWTFLLSFAVLLILLYFLLASGDLFLRKLIHVLPTMADKKRAVQIAREIEFSISRYLLTAALINSALGTCGGIAFWLLGVPDPALWGMMGALLNFIPYVGAATTIGVVAIISSVTFPTLGHAVLPPLAYFLLATLEGNFITPMIMGHRLTLNPLVIFIGLTFWGWLWGILGALLAVPLLVMFKIICDHTEPLAPIGEFLGR